MIHINKIRIISLRSPRIISAASVVKKSQYSIVCILIFLLIRFHSGICCFAQEDQHHESINSILEEIAEAGAGPEEMEILAGRLFDLYEDPVKINSPDEEEIARLFFLTDFQIKSIADYVRTTGSIVSINEIALIPGFSKSASEMIIPFITLDYARNDQMKKEGVRHRLVTSLFIKPGYHDPSYLGSPLKSISRYRMEAGKVSAGMTAEKDPGEKFFPGKVPVTDFFSAYISYQPGGTVKQMIAGDYSLRFGHGLAINNGIRSTLYLSTPGNISGPGVARPYTSTDENNFFRGFAGVIQIAGTEMTMFLSSNNIDATISRNADSSSYFVGSLYNTGYHNTASSLSRKDKLREEALGMNISSDWGNTRAGILLTCNFFSLPFLADPTSPSEIFSFAGKRNQVLSLYYRSTIRRFIISGELAGNSLNRYAYVQAFQVKPSDRLNINTVFRHSNPGFYSHYGKVPGISSEQFNGTGIFANFSLEAARYLFLSAGIDLINNRWISYRSSSPSSSIARELRLQYLPPSGMTLESILSFRSRPYDEPSDQGMPSQKEYGYRSFRLKVSWPVNTYLRLVTRGDYKWAFPDKGRGFLLLQDINYRSEKIPISVWLRYCIYNTAGFESGIYTWENDILNSYSVPVQYGIGYRFYIMASWKPVSNMELRLRYALTSREENRIAVRSPEFRLQLVVHV